MDWQQCYNCELLMTKLDDPGYCPRCGFRHWAIYLNRPNLDLGNSPDLEIEKPLRLQ